MPRIFKKSVFKFVQSQWGKEDEDTDIVFEDMEEFFVDMLKKRDWILDDQTWNDMDMNRVFRKVNRTFSSSGQQVLEKINEPIPSLELRLIKLKCPQHIVQHLLA